MNRTDLQKLATIRAKEADTLFKARLYSGAYYLAGYAIECALKACIARRIRRHEFPDRNFAKKAWDHELEKLLGLSGLKEELDSAARADLELDKNWKTVQAWEVECRYDRLTKKAKARDMIHAVADPQKGILPWLQARW